MLFELITTGTIIAALAAALHLARARHDRLLNREFARVLNRDTH